MTGGSSPFSSADVQLAITELGAHAPIFGSIGPHAFPNDPTGSDPSLMGASIRMFFLALEGYVTCGQDSAAVHAAVSALAVTLTAGNEPSASEPLYYWSEGPLSAAIALLDKTQGDPLGAAGIKSKAELLLEAEAAGANGNYNDSNNVKADMVNMERGDASPGVSTSVRTWSHTHNPNYLGGPFAIIACDFALAGGCDSFLSTFNYQAFTGQLTAAGFNHIVTAWNNNAAHVATAVKKPWLFAGHHATDYNGIFEAVAVSGWASPTYTSTAITSGDPACHNATIVNNPTGDPVLGKPGQIGEFLSKDSAGCRSDALYALEAMSHTIYGAALLKAIGKWAPIGNTVPLMHNGATDLFYKIDNTYNSFGLGQLRVVAPDSPTAKAFWPTSPAYDIDNPDTKGYHFERAMFQWENI